MWTPASFLRYLRMPRPADEEYALRAAAMDARSEELDLGHTAPDTERDYLDHLPEDHELFNTMDRDGKPLKD